MNRSYFSWQIRVRGYFSLHPDYPVEAFDAARSRIRGWRLLQGSERPQSVAWERP
jgi:hypothetical protein